MKIINLKDLSPRNYQRIFNRSTGNYEPVMRTVEKIIGDVKKNKDLALIQLGKKFYGKNYSTIVVSPEEIKEAYRLVNKQTIKALGQMIKNITAVQSAQLVRRTEPPVNSEKGIKVWREWRAIEKVGIYIPGGKAIYPSSVLMTAIPAQIAGCKEIIMCSPPKKTGQIPAVTLVAADMVGIKQIYKLGGAEAIAAMAYGTKTVPKVYKIFGAGNSFVTAAKILVQKDVAIDMPAGPSEVFILADKTANPAYIAADLLADGEHGEDSACVLLTTSREIAEQTKMEIGKQLAVLPTASSAGESLKKYGLIAIIDNLQEGIDFINDYAPEHLEIMVRSPEEIVKKINNAGSIFLGNYTSKSSGDYATGANHVLPTGGWAKMYPPLGIEAYGKWMQVQKCTKRSLTNIRETIETIAEVEQLPAHKYSSQVRIERRGKKYD